MFTCSLATLLGNLSYLELELGPAGRHQLSVSSNNACSLLHTAYCVHPDAAVRRSFPTLVHVAACHPNISRCISAGEAAGSL